MVTYLGETPDGLRVADVKNWEKVNESSDGGMDLNQTGGFEKKN